MRKSNLHQSPQHQHLRHQTPSCYQLLVCSLETQLMEFAHLVSGSVGTIPHASLKTKNAMGKLIAHWERIRKVEMMKMCVGVAIMMMTMRATPQNPPLPRHAPQPWNPGCIPTSWRELVPSAQQAHQLKRRVPMFPRRDGIRGMNRCGRTGRISTGSTAGGTSSSLSQDGCPTLCQKSA